VEAQHGTNSIAGMSMEAGVKAWWCWAKPCLTNSLQMESACWLTGTELAWMASTSLCKFGGKAMALPLGTLTKNVFGWSSFP